MSSLSERRRRRRWAAGQRRRLEALRRSRRRVGVPQGGLPVRIGRGLLFGAVSGAVLVAVTDRLALPVVNAVLLPGKAAGGCHVTRVIDGDTVAMICASGGALRGRLTGVDTPEIFSPGCASELRRGLEAKIRLQSILWSADEVKIVRSGTDRYGRALITMFADGRRVAGQLIAEGLGRPYGGGKRIGWCG